MSADLASGRSNQKRRTRQALLDAASQLLTRADAPTLEQIAEAALVSRATAYRYFRSADEVIAEALLTSRLKSAEQVLRRVSGDPVQRLLAVEAAVNGVLITDERALHMMGRALMDQWLAGDEGDVSARSGKRMALIDAALDGTDGSLTPAARRRLRNAVSLAIGLEAIVVLRDVCGLSRAEARRTAQWAVQALVAHASSD